MKRIIILAVAALALAGCTLDQFYQVEQDAATLIAKIKAGAQVISAEVDSVVTNVCTNALPSVNAEVMNITNALPNPGPRTATALRNANADVAGAAAACAAYAASPNKAEVALNLWAAYLAGKNAAVAARTAAGA